MCKLHGVRLIEGIEIFESMFQLSNLPSFFRNKTQLNYHAALIIITPTTISISIIRNFEQNCGLSIAYFKICKFHVLRQAGSSPVFI